MLGHNTVGVWTGVMLAGFVVVGGAVGAVRGQGSATTRAQAEAARIAVTEFTPLQACSGVLVVDVRNETSFKAGHIPGAINVPIDDIQTRALMLIDRAGGRPIVTYCSCPHEHTSALAALALREAGANRVRALVGGYPAWVEAGGAVER